MSNKNKKRTKDEQKIIDLTAELSVANDSIVYLERKLTQLREKHRELTAEELNAFDNVVSIEAFKNRKQAA